LGQRKSYLIKQVTSEKRFNIYDRTRKGLPLNTGDCLIEVTTCLTVLVYIGHTIKQKRNTSSKKSENIQ